MAEHTVVQLFPWHSVKFDQIDIISDCNSVERSHIHGAFAHAVSVPKVSISRSRVELRWTNPRRKRRDRQGAIAQYPSDSNKKV